jgi:hypothetical protein
VRQTRLNKKFGIFFSVASSAGGTMNKKPMPRSGTPSKAWKKGSSKPGSSYTGFFKQNDSRS